VSIVRELTTLLDFKVDPAGVNQYEASVNKVKSLALSIGKAFGIVFAAEKIYGMIDGLVDAGKEINKLQYQLTRMARAGDDVGEAMDTIFQTAQNTGVSYRDALGVYKEFLNESKELDVSQSQILTSVDNIYKGLRLSAASGEEINQTFEALFRSFRMVRIGTRQYGMLEQIAPGVVDALASSLGKTREQLREMAKEGTLTSKVLIDGLGKTIRSLDEDFAKRPIKLGEAFAVVWNELDKLAGKLWQLYNVTGYVAKGIVWLTKQIVDTLKAWSNQLGGIQRIVEILGITMAVVFGPKLFVMLATVARATLAWAAANFITVAGYLALAAAIAGVVLLIDDFMVWMRGGDSVLGDWLGPFDKFMESFKKMFEDADFFAVFRGIRDLFKGDFSEAMKEFGIATKDVSGWLGIIAATVVFIIGLSFLNWFLGLGKAVTTMAGLTTATTEAKAALVALNEVSFLGLMGRLMLLGATVGAIVQLLLTKGDSADPNQNRPSTPAEIDAAKEAQKNINKQYGYTGNLFGDTWTWLKRGLGWSSPSATDPDVPPGIGMVPTAPSVLPVTPGAATPPVAGDQNNTVNQNNNVTITGTPEEISNQVTKTINDMSKQILDGLARQAASSAPRTESATQ
jgi:tape measure domain-containing protein